MGSIQPAVPARSQSPRWRRTTCSRLRARPLASPGLERCAVAWRGRAWAPLWPFLPRPRPVGFSTGTDRKPRGAQPGEGQGARARARIPHGAATTSPWPSGARPCILPPLPRVELVAVALAQRLHGREGTQTAASRASFPTPRAVHAAATRCLYRPEGPLRASASVARLHPRRRADLRLVARVQVEGQGERDRVPGRPRPPPRTWWPPSSWRASARPRAAARAGDTSERRQQLLLSSSSSVCVCCGEWPLGQGREMGRGGRTRLRHVRLAQN